MNIDIEKKLRIEIDEAMQKYAGFPIDDEMKKLIQKDVREVFMRNRDLMVEYAIHQTLQHFGMI